MDGIVLLTKKAGLTSFSSLYNVKKALNTTKVGHTGTLDSFAQGLLVVCTGRYTRLASQITEFNKNYKAVISFGKETDTLEYTGKTIKSTSLPDLNSLKKAIEKHIGKILQVPPTFSAIHVNGQRASDLARKGKIIEIPKREVQVFSAELQDVLLDEKGFVKSCLIDFHVSKGTYIRSLARDIATECNSSGYLSGLYRTKVGEFSIECSAGYDLLQPFTLQNCLAQENEFLKNQIEKQKEIPVAEKKKTYVETSEDIQLKKEIIEKILPMNITIAKECGFYPLELKDDYKEDFLHGKPIKKSFFKQYMDDLKDKELFAVFASNKDFLGLVAWKNENCLYYKFVNSQKIV